MEDKPIEWNEIWETKDLKVTQVKRDDRSIYVLSNPLSETDVIAIEGKTLVAFSKHLLINEGEMEREHPWDDLGYDCGEPWGKPMGVDNE